MTAIEPGRLFAAVGTGTIGRGTARVVLVDGRSARLHDALPGRAEQGCS
jgi:3-hydroxybutyryl-CoA dehydrogenase